MRRLKIIEHISLDGVIQNSNEDGDFPYSDWGAPYRTPTVRKVLRGARTRTLDRTSSRAFDASSRRTARTLSSRVAPR